ncbi:hypothetical protein [Ruminococcus flavefaciens]|uniref:hypothetical protein n=1 Tax=Ruminococcus flavefaciens TaxID=1265 RepID=UPI00048FBCF5|nr:hypothetical protein [Ruminococcus flavefaciens]
MKNIIKKIASIAMAFTLLGTGTNVTRTILPESNNTIVANAGTKDYDNKGSIKLKTDEFAQGMGMYNNIIYFVTEKGNSNCKLYKKNPNEETPKTITIKNCDPNIIRHPEDRGAYKIRNK